MYMANPIIFSCHGLKVPVLGDVSVAEIDRKSFFFKFRGALRDVPNTK